MSNTKKAIFIDWHNTLSNSLFWTGLADSNHPLNEYHNDVFKWLFVSNKDISAKWMRGEMKHDQIVGLLASELGIEADMLTEELVLSCKEMKIYDERIFDLVAAIRKSGARVVIATDNMDTFDKYTVPQLGLGDKFDHILNSYNVGCVKSDTNNGINLPFFDEYLSKNGLSYSDCVLIDDSSSAMDEYESLGFERVLISGPEELYGCLYRYC